MFQEEAGVKSPQRKSHFEKESRPDSAEKKLLEVQYTIMYVVS